MNNVRGRSNVRGKGLNRNLRKRRNRRRESGLPKSTEGSPAAWSTRIPKGLGGSSPFSTYQVYELAYFEPNLVVQNAAASFIVKDWRINSAFDPDPALGGGSLVGYNQIAAIYSQYHVEECALRYTVACNEPGLPLTFGWTMKDFQPSTAATTYAAAQDLLELAPTTGAFTVGETTGNSIYRSPWYKFSPGMVLGNPSQYMVDSVYSSAVTTNPTQVLWMSFCLFAPSSTTFLTNGVIMSVNIRLRTRFYSLASGLV